MARDGKHDVGLLFLRVSYAGMLIGFHGWARFFRAFNYAVHHQPWTFVALVQRLGFPIPGVFAVLSALAESIGALCIGLGFFTRWAALIVAINMSVAFYNEAAKWSNGGTPELPGLYLIGALVIIILGGGRYGIDGAVSRRR